MANLVMSDIVDESVEWEYAGTSGECDEGCDCLSLDEEDGTDDTDDWEYADVCGIHLISGECDESCISR